MPNIKRATIWGLILTLITFVVATILVLISPDLHLILGIFLFPIVIFLYSKFLYFRKDETEASMKEGFYVGLYWLILAIVYDIIIVVYVLGVGWDFLSNWVLIIHYIELVVFTILGALTEKKL